MRTVDLLVVAGYLLCMVAVGRYFARRQRDSEDFFLGGRRMPAWAVAISVFASLASTVGYLGDPGEIIRHGIGMFVRFGALPFYLAVTLWVIVPFFRRAGVTTVFEILEQRFGRSTRLLGVGIWCYMQLAFLGLVLLLASRVIARMTGVGEIYVILAIGAASVLYTSAGGLKSVIWTDVIQFVFLFLGVLVTLVVIAAETGTGPRTWWLAVSGTTHPLPPLVSTDLATRHTILGALIFGFVVNLSYNCSEQVVVQRYAATPRPVLMMLANYGAGVLFTLLQIAVGAALLVYYTRFPEALPQGVTDVTQAEFADDAFPDFIQYHLPVGLSGLVIAALLGAAQSTMDSGVNSIAAVMSHDVLPAFGYQRAAGDLQLARWTTRGAGLGVLLMAILAGQLSDANNIIDIAQKVVHLGLGPMGGLLLVTILGLRGSALAANTALLLGLAAALVGAFGDQLLGRPLLSPLLIIPVSWLVTLVAAPLLVLLSGGRTVSRG